MSNVHSLVAAGAIALALSGCAEVEKAEDFLTSAKTTAAVSTLQKGATALVCTIANAALVAGEVESAIAAGQSVQGTDGKLYVASATVCSALGGRVTGSATLQ